MKERNFKELIIIAGPNGSGKSTLAGQLTLPTPFINADMYAKSKYAHIVDEGERAQQASLAVAQKIKECIKQGASFAFETVFAMDNLPHFLRAAKSDGYQITIHFIAVDNVELNVERVALRVKQGGHNIPTDLIRSRHKKVIALLPELILFADKIVVYDNTGKGMRPFLVKEEEKIKIVDDIPRWAIKAIGSLYS